MNHSSRTRLCMCTTDGLLVAAAGAVGLSMMALMAASGAEVGQDALRTTQRQFSPPASGGVAGGCPGAGDCCTENGTPGCEDVLCCQAVCDLDSFCCNVVWDNVCADEAQNVCPDLCGGGASNCCFAHPFPGCDDPVCEEAVCFTDAFCCDVEWDQNCVNWALLFCPELCG